MVSGASMVGRDCNFQHNYVYGTALAKVHIIEIVVCFIASVQVGVSVHTTGSLFECDGCTFNSTTDAVCFAFASCVSCGN